MANTKSAKKAIRSSLRKRKQNDSYRRRYRLASRNVVTLVESGKKEDASKALDKAYTELDKSVKINLMHKNTAARYKSQLAKKVSRMSKKIKKSETKKK
ncbi:MAG TPA: 30S ribosomal protein S20 [bacterium]|nr:30S ribosomal protein S20 [bacterium]